MACARLWYALKQLPIEEYSIAELLEDPIGALLMKSDGVDRQTLEYALTWSDRPSDCEHHNGAPPRAIGGSRGEIRPCFWAGIRHKSL